MNPIFIEVMTSKFPNQFTTEFGNDHLFLVFPAKNPDFGDVDICEDYPGAYIVTLGKFTHGHFDVYDGSDDEKAKEAAEEVVDFLENLFADRIVCFGAHETGGGYCFNNSNDIDECANKWGDLFVWSGFFKKAESA